MEWLGRLGRQVGLQNGFSFLNQMGELLHRIWHTTDKSGATMMSTRPKALDRAMSSYTVAKMAGRSCFPYSFSTFGDKLLVLRKDVDSNCCKTLYFVRRSPKYSARVSLSHGLPTFADEKVTIIEMV